VKHLTKCNKINEELFRFTFKIGVFMRGTAISTIILVLIILVPSTQFADEMARTGYDLYHDLKVSEDPNNVEDMTVGLHALGYLKGCIDGFVFMQDVQYNQMFPPKYMSEKEAQKLSKEMNFHRLNFPKDGIPTGQMVLIYKNFAEKYPKELSGSARVCIFKSLIEAYGWK
jgi:hypothetical protein